MTRTLVTILVLGMILTLPAAIRADDEEDPQENKSDTVKQIKKVDDGEMEEEFHLDFSDLKDLKEADIILPDLDDGMEGADGDEAKAEDEEEEEEPIYSSPEELQEAVKRIIENMGQSADRLVAKTDPGKQTQDIQDKVIDDLSDLVEHVKQQQQKSQSQSKSKSKSKKDSQKQQGGQQPGNSQGQGRGRGQSKKPKGNQAAQEEKATHGSVDGIDESENMTRLLEEKWGNLLPNANQDTLQGLGTQGLPQYRELLNRYFYSLARQATEESGDQ